MRTDRLLTPSLAEPVSQCRREFLTSTASGLGLAALGAALAGDGVLGAQHAHAALPAGVEPLVPRPPHFAPRAKSCILIFMAGAPASSTCSTPSRSSTS